MKIYFMHSTQYPEFRDNLYAPIKQSILGEQVEIILPHELQGDLVHSKDIIMNADLVIADVSFPSTGVGVEIGWADMLNRKIIFIYLRGAKISSSLQFISPHFIEYIDSFDLRKKLDLLYKNIGLIDQA